MTIRFWGTRGSTPCPGQAHLRYGGNTACVEVRAGAARIILDAGTGLRPLGDAWLAEPASGPLHAVLLLSHTHWDHISGFPFFKPAFQPSARLHVLAGHLAPQTTIRSVMAGQMLAPFFPVPLDHMDAQLEFHDFRAGERFALPGGGASTVQVRTIALNHPGGATAYRLDYEGRSVCYVTDTEHQPGTLDAGILDLIAGTGLMIYDATYTDEEMAAKAGWGHSSWQQGIRLAEAAGVERVALFHHDPEKTDAVLAGISAEATARFAGAFVAAEGQVIDL